MELDVFLQSEALFVFTPGEDGFVGLLRMVAADTNLALMLLFCRRVEARKLFQNRRHDELAGMILCVQMTQLTSTTVKLMDAR